MTEKSKFALEIAKHVGALAKVLGAKEVVVMIGVDDEIDGVMHSAYAHWRLGACLPVRGLVETCLDEIAQQEWK